MLKETLQTRNMRVHSRCICMMYDHTIANNEHCGFQEISTLINILLSTFSLDELMRDILQRDISLDVMDRCAVINEIFKHCYILFKNRQFFLFRNFDWKFGKFNEKFCYRSVLVYFILYFCSIYKFILYV